MSWSALEDATLEDEADRTNAKLLRPSPRRPGPAGSSLAHRILRRVLHAAGNPPLSVKLWDGTTLPATWRSGPGVVIHDPATLWKLALDPLFQFGEAYADGRLDVEGDLAELLSAIYAHQPRNGSLAARLARWWHRPRRNTLSGSRDNIHRHYDLGNDFYELWLDEQLVYTCAYFPQAACSLEEAQIAKMRHVCRKLRLRPGETVLEAGCGWGALALYMARHHGVTVRAFNISREQVAYARQRAQEEGLAGRVEFVEDDWRSMNQPCDVFVSIGMLEHVGPSNYRRLGEVIHRCLRPAGRGLIHTIAQIRPEPINPWIERRIFPGAYPPTLAQMMQILDPFDFSVLDVENLRLHYAQTLRHWRDRFEQRVHTVRERFGEKFVRMWRLYLCGSLAAFLTGGLHLYQVLFARSTNNEIPWTRADIYEAA